MRAVADVRLDPAQVAVAVIAKEPVAGRVKTRLSPPCSPEEAALLAEASLADTLDAVAASQARRRLLYLEGSCGDWLPDGFEVLAQAGGGLAARLDAVFAHLDGPAVVIGMDTPQVGAESVDLACGAIAGAGVQAVLGPAHDGGFWAIGFRRHVAGAFAGVPMSRADTGARQARRLDELGLCVAALPALRDIDHWADAVAVAAQHPSLRTSALVSALSPRLHVRSAGAPREET